MLFCSSRTIDRWVKRFHREGVEAVAGHKPGRPFRFGPGWLAVVVDWVTTKVPRDFGFLRSRWCCEVVALLMLRDSMIWTSAARRSVDGCIAAAWSTAGRAPS